MNALVDRGAPLLPDGYAYYVGLIPSAVVGVTPYIQVGIWRGDNKRRLLRSRWESVAFVNLTATASENDIIEAATRLYNRVFPTVEDVSVSHLLGLHT